MIASAFLKCGISNNLDGTQDHLVYENDENDENDDIPQQIFADTDSDESGFEGFEIE